MCAPRRIAVESGVVGEDPCGVNGGAVGDEDVRLDVSADDGVGVCGRGRGGNRYSLDRGQRQRA